MNTSATHRPVRTDITMKEKEAIIRNDARVASTFLDHTHDDEGGRFPDTGVSYEVSAL